MSRDHNPLRWTLVTTDPCAEKLRRPPAQLGRIVSDYCDRNLEHFGELEVVEADDRDARCRVQKCHQAALGST
jgi:hypothetical protein